MPHFDSPPPPIQPPLEAFSNLITNESHNTLHTRLQDIIAQYEKCDICAISGFYNARAFCEIANSSDKIRSILLILGRENEAKNSDKLAFYLRDNELYSIDAQLDEIAATKIAHNFIATHNVKIFTLKAKNILIHAKLYYIYDNECANRESHAIVGSSNFTASGLGLYGGNKELNLICNDKRDISACKAYFDNLLASCKDSTQIVQDALNTSYFYHSPRAILEKIASLYANEFAELDTSTTHNLEVGAKHFKLYDFQILATKEILKRLKNYGIALLADPVGSGKTLTALAVASAYHRAVIITPAKLKAQWESYIENNSPIDVDIFTYDNAKKANNIYKDKISKARLIIIDESHNLRNDNKTYSKIRENLSTCDILLLSATPINNNHLDLARQLKLQKKPLNINGEILDAKKICITADKATQEALNNNKEIALDSNYYKLTKVIFARSSKDIESFLIAQNKPLPKQNKICKHLSSIPQSIDFSLEKLLILLNGEDFLDSLLENLDSQDLFESDSHESQNTLSLCIYDPFREEYLSREIIESLKNKKGNLENLGDYSTPRGFLCMNLIKALESSVDAFLSMLEHIIAYHSNFLDSFALESNISDDLDDSLESVEKGGALLFPERLKRVIDCGYINELSKDFIAQVRRDKDLLDRLKEKLSMYDSKHDFKYSAKFMELCKIIKNIKNIKREKLLIFSESIITANALTRALKAEFVNLEVESITGNSSSSHFRNCKNRFSPHSLGYKMQENEREIDILVATDCLSEGQNLQDCANFLNWDIAFNPVRSIQRIGRIWRIGSKNKQIYITHFFPDIEFEAYIALEAKLKYKLEAAASATPTDNPFKEAQKNHYEKKRKEYDALIGDETQSIDAQNFPNIATLLQSHLGAINVESKNDGIFSIMRDSRFRENAIFATLQDLQDAKYYHCIFNLTNNELLPSVSEEHHSKNISEILALSTISTPQMPEFERLENFTNNYRDLSALKGAFSSLTDALDLALNERELEINKHSDGGLVMAEKRKFRLIAWLLLNPNFEVLSHFKGSIK